MANNHFFLRCKECGEKFRIAKSNNLGWYVPDCDDFVEQLNDFFEKHAYCNGSENDGNYELKSKGELINGK